MGISDILCLAVNAIRERLRDGDDYRDATANWTQTLSTSSRTWMLSGCCSMCGPGMNADGSVQRPPRALETEVTAVEDTLKRMREAAPTTEISDAIQDVAEAAQE